jgi:hypothetical protein
MLCCASRADDEKCVSEIGAIRIACEPNELKGSPGDPRATLRISELFSRGKRVTTVTRHDEGD